MEAAAQRLISHSARLNLRRRESVKTIALDGEVLGVPTEQYISRCSQSELVMVVVNIQGWEVV